MVAPITASAHTHMGTTPPGYDEEWVTHTVHVHGFTSLPSVRGEAVDSPEFVLLGNQWLLRIYPGGDDDAEEGMVFIYLENRSNKSIEENEGRESKVVLEEMLEEYQIELDSYLFRLDWLKTQLQSFNDEIEFNEWKSNRK